MHKSITNGGGEAVRNQKEQIQSVFFSASMRQTEAIVLVIFA